MSQTIEQGNFQPRESLDPQKPESDHKHDQDPRKKRRNKIIGGAAVGIALSAALYGGFKMGEGSQEEAPQRTETVDPIEDDAGNENEFETSDEAELDNNTQFGTYEGKETMIGGTFAMIDMNDADRYYIEPVEFSIPYVENADPDETAEVLQNRLDGWVHYRSKIDVSVNEVDPENWRSKGLLVGLDNAHNLQEFLAPNSFDDENELVNGLYIANQSLIAGYQLNQLEEEKLDPNPKTGEHPVDIIITVDDAKATEEGGFEMNVDIDSEYNENTVVGRQWAELSEEELANESTVGMPPDHRNLTVTLTEHEGNLVIESAQLNE